PALDARFLFPFSFPIDVRMCLIGVVGIRRVSDDGLCERGGMYILVSRTSFSSVIRFAIWDLISRSQLNPRIKETNNNNENKMSHLQYYAYEGVGKRNLEKYYYSQA